MSINEFAVYEAKCLILQIQNNCFGDFNTDEKKNKEIERLQKVASIDDFYNSKVFNENKEIQTETIRKLAGKNEANTASACFSCGAARFKVIAQRRSSDEAANNEIHCPGCNRITFE